MLTLLALAASLALSDPDRASDGAYGRAQDPPATILLHGALAIVDDAGRRPAGSGRFTLWLSYRDGSRDFDVPVSQGRFEMRVPVGADYLEVGRVEIDGMEAHVEGKTGSLPADGALDLEARWTPVSTLRVLARDSGRELQQVELVESPTPDYPAEFSRSLGKRLASPVRIDPWSDESMGHGWARTRSYWARAPGYAWARIEFDHSVGGERRLELEPDAAIVIELVGAEPGRQLMFRLLDAEHPTLPPSGPTFQPSEDPPTVIESLVPRHYTVELIERTDMLVPEPRVLARRDVPLRSAQAAQVRFDMAEIRAESTGVVFEGTLAIPPAWGDARTEIDFMRLDPATNGYVTRNHLSARQMQPASGAGPLHWKIEDAEPGRWLVFVQPFQISRIFELRADAAAPVTIDVPPPADVRVQLVDRTSGEPIVAHNIGWYAMPPPQPSGVIPAAVRYDAEQKAFVFRAPIEEIVLSVWIPDYEVVFVPKPMHAGVNEFTVELSRTSKICVRLRDGNALVPVGNDARIDARSADGPGTNAGAEYSNGRVCLVFSAPGRYVVEVSGMPGYESAKSAPTTVGVGETVEVEIALVRKP